MGGGGESAELAFKGLKPYLVGHNPFELEALRFKISNPTASLYNNRTQLHAALEFACLDLMGQKFGVPVSTYSEANFATRCRSPVISFSGMRTPKPHKAKFGPRTNLSGTRRS